MPSSIPDLPPPQNSNSLYCICERHAPLGCLCSLLDNLHMKVKVDIQSQGFQSIKSSVSKCQRKNSTLWMFLPLQSAKADGHLPKMVLTRLVSKGSFQTLTKPKTSRILKNGRYWDRVEEPSTHIWSWLLQSRGLGASFFPGFVSL